MKISALLMVPATVLAVGAMSGTAAAHPVGTPGTPSCFGERISHGSSVHAKDDVPDNGGTPKERAAGLQALVDAGFPPAVALFGPTVSVQEMIEFVQANCSDDPIVPPEG